VIHIGANIGWISLLASRIIGSDGRVFSFEPSPDAFNVLSATQGLERYCQPPSEDILDDIRLEYIASPCPPSLESATE
jgi:hypothetical protein